MTNAPLIQSETKHPFQWVCWSDYVNHPQLRLCSLAARGLWPDILKVCWEASPRGYFLIDGKAPSVADLAQLASIPVEMVQAAFAELEAKGVFARTPGANTSPLVVDGTVYCRRMINDVARNAAKKAKEQASGEATPTERELVDRAVREALTVANQEEDRKAKNRKRQNEYRARKRAEQQAQTGVEKMRAFEHMAAAAARSDAGSVTLSGVTGDVTPPATVTLQALRVTSPISSETNALDPPAPFLSSIFHLQEEKHPVEPERSGGSLRHPPGGSPPGRDEGQGTPADLQARVVSSFRNRPLIQSPAETDEAFAARCAERQASAA